MLYTFKDACMRLAPTVQNGLQYTSESVKKRVNECQEAIMFRLEPQFKRRFMKFTSYNGIICCPANVDRIIRHAFFNCPRSVYSEFYQFLEYGPGANEYLKGGRSGDLADIGNNYASFFDPHTCMNLMAFSDSTADENLELTVTGASDDGFLPVVGTFQQEDTEAIPIVQRKAGMETMHYNPENGSKKQFSRILRVNKPVTAGNVLLVGYIQGETEADLQMWVLGKYGPSEQVPNYRRYKVAGIEDGAEAEVYALCQLAHSTMIHDTDIPIIQNLAALEFESRSIEAYKTDTGRGMHLQNKASKLVRDEIINSRVESTEITYDVSDEMGPRGL